MTTSNEAPLQAYYLRAGTRHCPSHWAPPEAVEHTLDQAEELAAAGSLFWADIAEFQSVVTKAYPYKIIGIRGDNGYSTDGHARENWAVCESWEQIISVPVYSVFKTGQGDAILSRLKNTFGAECPPKLRPEVDMESGSQFAGPGNHSTEANDFVEALAEWSGSQKRPGGYANAPDWSSNWPSHPSWLKRRLARYSNTIPDPGDYFDWQYYGGMNYPVPAGFPTSVAPFGQWVDLNVVVATSNPNTYLDDTGMDWLSMATEKQVRSIVEQEIIAAQQAMYLGGEHKAPGGNTYGPEQNPKWARAAGHGVGARLNTVEVEVSAIKKAKD